MSRFVTRVRTERVSTPMMAAGERFEALSRRTFLIGGATALLTAVAATEGRTQQALKPVGNGNLPLPGAGSANLLPLAGLGYWSPVENIVMAASRLTRGEHRYIKNGVNVTIHGRGNDSSDPEIAACTLFAHFVAGAAQETLKFHAWKYQYDGVQCHRSQTCFFMPVSPANGLTFSLAYPWQGDSVQGSVRTENNFHLSAETHNNSWKLQQGVYFVALPDSRMSALPVWDSCRFIPDYVNGVLTGGTLYEPTSQGLKPVSYPYLILSVDPILPIDLEQDPEQDAF